jgi:hypothetical protein
MNCWQYLLNLLNYLKSIRIENFLSQIFLDLKHLSIFASRSEKAPICLTMTILSRFEKFSNRQIRDRSISSSPGKQNCIYKFLQTKDFKKIYIFMRNI